MKVNVFEDGEIRIVPFDENDKWFELTPEQEVLLNKGFLGYKNGQLVDLTTHFQAQQEIAELREWFDDYYAKHEQKYRRLHTLDKLTDEGKNAYDELIKLYQEAEVKRIRIQELEKI